MLSLQIPDELKIKLKEEAKEKELSVSALIRLIIKDYYKNK